MRRRIEVRQGSTFDDAPTMELDVELEGSGDRWRARLTSSQAPPPGADGPVVVTLLDGPDWGARADAELDIEGGTVQLRGRSPFIAPEG